jgi:hypothetical protein
MFQLSLAEIHNLFAMRKPQDVESFIQSLLQRNHGGWDWRNLGDLENNAGNVRFSEEPGLPIVERIINMQEALLELAYYEAGKPRILPSSPRKAVQEWFKIPGGYLNASKDSSFFEELASKLRVDVYDSGVEKRPSIAFHDRGIGQHPDDLPTTILSLGGSNKLDKLYLSGVFGQGGSSAYAWCKYSIVVSRRRPEHIGGKPDLVGWTIVREYDSPSLKVPIYQYLVTKDREIPSFSPSFLEGTGFDFGTYIIHIAYDLGRLSGPWTRVGYPYFDNLLFDPVLPYVISDNRYHDRPEYRVKDMKMYGGRKRLSEVVANYSKDIYHKSYTFNLDGNGALIIRFWVFKKQRSRREEEGAPKITSYLENERSSRTVVITLNGQRHDYLEKSFVNEVVGSSLLADRLVMQVDCDDLSLSLRKKLITSPRMRFRTGEHLDLIKECVRKALEDEELRQIKGELWQREFAEAGEGDEHARSILNSLIKAGRKIEEGAGPQKGKSKGQGGKGPQAYKSKDPPSFFRFAEEKETLEIEPGAYRFIDIRTDGPDNMFFRKHARARHNLEIVPNDQSITVSTGSLHKGRLNVIVKASESAHIGSTYTLRAQLEIEGGVYVLQPTERKCKVVAPPPPYVGKDPPTEFHIVAKGNTLKLKQGRVTRVSVRTNCSDDLLSRPHQPGKIQESCMIKGVRLEAIGGPTRGEIELHYKVPQDIPLGTEGNLEVALILADGTKLQDSKPCIIVEAPLTDFKEGQKQVVESNFKFIEVWKNPPSGASDNFKTWDQLGWDETKVGHCETNKQNGEEAFVFLINMDFSDYTKERDRFYKRLATPTINRLKHKYKAYISYYLWQLQHSLRDRQDSPAASEEEGQTQIDEELIEEEKRRVSKTILAAIRPEKELVEILQSSE